MSKAQVKSLIISSEREGIKTDYKIIAWQRAEGLFMLAFGIAGFSWFGVEWWVFALLLLLPDISMAGYLVNKRVGAFCYNTAHSLVFPTLLALLYFSPAGIYVYAYLACIWLAHIGLDRTLGYGLKYDDDFKHTHLGWIGKK